MKSRHALAAAWLIAIVVPQFGCGPEATDPVTTRTVASVVVLPSADTLVSLGATVKMSATARDTQGRTVTGRAIVWRTSNPSVATVSSSGEVTAQGNGEVTITATVDTVSGSATILVQQAATLISMSFPRDTLTAIGDTMRAAVTVLDAGGSDVVDAAIAWSTSDAAVLTIDTTGLVTAAGNGSADITGMVDGTSSTRLIIVSQIVEHLELIVQPSTATAGVPIAPAVEVLAQDANGHDADGLSVTVEFEVNPNGGTLSGTTTSDVVTGVARFDDLWIDKAGSGYTLLVSAGSAVRDTSAAFAVLAASPASVAIEPKGATLPSIGASQQFVGSIVDAFGNVVPNQTALSWSTLNPRVAVVGQTGLAVAQGLGQASFLASAGGGIDGYALVTVAGTGPTADTWDEVAIFSVNPLTDVWGTASDDVFAVGGNFGIWHFDGANWTRMGTGFWTAAHLAGVWGTAPDNVYAVGEAGLIFHYDGAMWDSVSGGLSSFLEDVWGTGPDDIFAVGVSGSIDHYNGTAWSSMNNETSATLHAVWGAAPNDVYAVGGGGIVLHYDGLEWSEVPSVTTKTLYGIWGTASDDIHVVGDAGVVLHYDGVSWSTLVSGTAVALLSIWGTGSDDVYAVGRDGTLVYHGNSGWMALSSGTTISLRGVWGTASDEVYVVGGYSNSGRVFLGSASGNP